MTWRVAHHYINTHTESQRHTENSPISMTQRSISPLLGRRPSSFFWWTCSILMHGTFIRQRKICRTTIPVKLYWYILPKKRKIPHYTFLYFCRFWCYEKTLREGHSPILVPKYCLNWTIFFEFHIRILKVISCRSKKQSVGLEIRRLYLLKSFTRNTSRNQS